MTASDLIPPTLPGEHPQAPRKAGFFTKFFTKEHTEDVAPSAPGFSDVDIEEIKRKLGLHEDHEVARPDPESFLPPAQNAPKDEVLWVAPKENVHVEEPVVKREEETPVATVEIADWTADAASAPVIPVKKAKTKGKDTTTVPSPSASPWAAETHVAAPKTAPSTPWVEHHEATTPVPQPPAHHEIIDQHLASIDRAHEKIIAGISAHPHVDLPEWHLQDQELPPSQYFILRNGQPVRSLKELLIALDYIDASTFEHHVNEYRNDFAHWIEDAIGQPELAATVRAATDRAGIIAALNAHADERIKQAQGHVQKAETLRKKHELTLEKLKDTHEKIQALHFDVDRKAQELFAERSRAGRLVKGALDKELERRLVHEREHVALTIAQLERGKNLYMERASELEAHKKALDARENAVAQKETVAREAESRAKAAKDALASEKAELISLKRETAGIKRQHEEAVTLHEQLDAKSKALASRESQLARREETLQHREEKVTADLTRIHTEREALAQERESHAPREAAARKKEEDAKKVAAASDARAKEALEQERASVARLREETKKLERVRTQIDKALAKVLKSKQKITSAVELRKHLEKALTGAKETIIAERKELSQTGYRAMVDTTVATTPIGQSGSDADEDFGRIRETEFTGKIAQARAALERRDLETARKAYDELRTSYAQVHENAPERSALYIAIRELYDDIHLAMLG